MNAEVAETEGVADVTESVESEAISKGWSPDKGTKTAQEFLDYEDDYSSRKNADKKLREENRGLRDRLDEMQDFQSQSANVQRGMVASRVEALKANRDNALEAGSGDLAKTIQAQLDKEQEILNSLPYAAAPVSEVNTDVIVDWSERNPWIEDGSEKALFAQDLFQELNHKAAKETAPGTPQSVIDAQWRRMLRTIDKEVAEEFNEAPASKGARKTAPGTVRNQRTTEQAVSTRDVKNLRSEDRKMHSLLVKSESNPSGTLTNAEFFKELDKANAARGVI